MNKQTKSRFGTINKENKLAAARGLGKMSEEEGDEGRLMSKSWNKSRA